VGKAYSYDSRVTKALLFDGFCMVREPSAGGDSPLRCGYYFALDSTSVPWIARFDFADKAEVCSAEFILKEFSIFRESHGEGDDMAALARAVSGVAGRRR